MFRILRAFAALVLCISFSSVSAQQIDVILRAGEHPDFTRIVLPLPEQVAWRLEQRQGQLDLIVEDTSISFDLSRTFDRIPRTRLRAVEIHEFGIRFILGCLCKVRRVEGISGQVVLDIVTPDETPEQATEGSIQDIVTRPRSRPVDLLERNRLISQRAGSALAKGFRNDDFPSNQELDKLLLIPFARAKLPQINPFPQDDSALTVEAGRNLTERVARAISSATARDLLSVNQYFTGTSGTPYTALSETAVDHLFSRDALGKPSSVAQETCAYAVSNFIPDWGASIEGNAGEPNWSELYDPLDRLDSKVALSLVASMLQIGFGAEARALLSLMPATQDKASLHSVSYLLDNQKPPTADVLLPFATCSDMDTLWAFLAAPEKIVGSPETQNRIVRAAQKLPASIRTNLGPIIVRQLLRQNAPETAQLVQATIDRAKVHDDERRASARPELLLALPQQVTALEAKASFNLSDEELLLFLENAETSGLTVPSNILSAAIAKQFEYRHSEMGRAFALAIARALARGRQFDAAFDMATNRDSALTDASRRALVADLLSSLVANSSDTIFVTTLFKHMPEKDDFVLPDLLMQISDRLNRLGFAKEAADLAHRVLSATDMPTTNAETASLGSFDTITTPAIPMLSATGTARNERDGVAQVQTTNPTWITNSNPLNQERDVFAQPTATANNLTDVTATAALSGGPRLSEGAALSEIAGAGQSAEPGLLEQGRASLRDAGKLRSELEQLLGESAALR